MANTLDGGSFPQVWAKEMQREHDKKDVFRAVASFKEEPTLKVGDVVNLPYRGSVYTEGYTRGTAVTPRNLTNANETLTVNVVRVVPFYIDDLDKIQSKYNDMMGYARLSRVSLGNHIDGDVLGEVDQATSDVDDGDLGGTDNNGIVTTTSNVSTIFTEATEALELLNVWNENDYFSVISPRFKAKLIAYLAGKESALGDSTGRNGHIGSWLGFDLYLSNNLTFTADLQIGTIPTATDTITINGVVLTFSASPSADGEIEQTNSATACVTNLYEALSAPTTDIAETSTAGYDAWQITDLAGAWNGLSATDNTTYLSIKLEGQGWVVVSELLTATADIWTAAKQIEHQLFGKKGATDVVIQAEPTVSIRKVSDKIGSNAIPYTLYGLTTTQAGDDELVDVKCSWA